MRTGRRGALRSAAVALIALLPVAGCGDSDRADGGDGAGDTAPPEPTVAPADLVALGSVAGFDDVGRATGLDPAQASLVGPTVAYAFDAVTTTDSLTAEQATALELAPLTSMTRVDTSGGLVPADGYEFLLLRTATADDLRPGPSAGIEADVTTTIDVAEESRRVDLTALDVAGDGFTLLVSVPTDAAAALVLTDEGRTQTLDLRAGRRGDDAVELFYPVRSASFDGRMSALASYDGVEVSGAAYHGQLHIDGGGRAASLVPFDRELGWADDGTGWLRVRLSSWKLVAAATVTLDAARSFTLETGGTAVPAEPGEVTVNSMFDSGSESSGTLVFQVPADFESGTLRLTPYGTVTVPADGGERQGTIRDAGNTEPVTVRLDD